MRVESFYALLCRNLGLVQIPSCWFKAITKADSMNTGKINYNLMAYIH